MAVTMAGCQARRYCQRRIRASSGHQPNRRNDARCPNPHTFAKTATAKMRAAGVVRVVRVAEEVSGHVRLKPYPKSKAGRRSVPLPPFVVQALTEHARDHEPGDQGLIFVARTGMALKRGTFRARVWKPSFSGPSAHGTQVSRPAALLCDVVGL